MALLRHSKEPLQKEFFVFSHFREFEEYSKYYVARGSAEVSGQPPAPAPGVRVLWECRQDDHRCRVC